ncbi:RICIN domain-containing protein [Mycobacterium sp. 1274761.0]|uniref:RICIN domain-containing protein n=1 Tax=Mycobacterium sp. 1274761.0 TaxID=1834077 RepID=UPI0007FF9018|nr:RICIN domain-containing protein [Mycobacterium sp. 1274761.0]OBK76705.1 hypothetical protein A5651_05570 [Mycobacterium sp. 1274761.0]
MSVTVPAGIQEHTRVVRLQGGGLRFLDVVDGRIVTRPFGAVDAQHWRIVDIGGGLCVVEQVSSGRLLDTTGNRAVIRPRRDDDSQRWRLEDLGGGFVTLEQVSSGRFLEAGVDGDFPVVTRPPGDNEQTWRLGDP